ncbi:MAG: hypothetical protein NT076_04900 [Candidatus Pacearchaeota archaeon]|nr:hypothetical protein [Candidatus Pacearchaeota archaeon]
MKTLFKFKYPKLTLLAIFIILSYMLFSNPLISSFISQLDNLKYLGIFIAGLLIPFGFTAPISVGFFIVANPSNILLSAIIAGFGAMLGDLFIFNIIRFSFMNEFNKLENTHAAKKLNKIIEKDLGKKIKNYLLYIFAGIIIASPLPDELGVIMLAGLTKINQKILATTSFILHTLGILVLLYI